MNFVILKMIFKQPVFDKLENQKTKDKMLLYYEMLLYNLTRKLDRVHEVADVLS